MARYLWLLFMSVGLAFIVWAVYTETPNVFSTHNLLVSCVSVVCFDLVYFGYRLSLQRPQPGKIMMMAGVLGAVCTFLEPLRTPSSVLLTVVGAFAMIVVAVVFPLEYWADCLIAYWLNDPTAATLQSVIDRRKQMQLIREDENQASGQ